MTTTTMMMLSSISRTLANNSRIVMLNRPLPCHVILRPMAGSAQFETSALGKLDSIERLESKWLDQVPVKDNV
jgi:hypothetical protein